MLYAFLLYGIFLSLKDIVRAPKTYVLGALYGGVGGIRTLGPLNTATRLPVGHERERRTEADIFLTEENLSAIAGTLKAFRG